MKKTTLLPCLLLLLAACGGSGSSPVSLHEADSLCPFPFPDTVRVNDLPALGKWMYRADSQPAHWLGVPFEGRIMTEPINVVLIDSISADSAGAVQALRRLLPAGGYEIRGLHSGGYFGYIGRGLHAQIPAEPDHAFSNQPAEIDNNHGRVFGPLKDADRFVFTASFSREKVEPLEKVKHAYASFDRARDEFAQTMEKSGSYRIAAFIDLKNRIGQSTSCTTGDHDGSAVLLKRIK